ncbi:MAG: periplasmic heavy metal sensor [Pseudomonadota bacterium]
MSTPTPAAPPVRTARWVKIVLTLSVALNLLIIGVAAGVAWKFRHGFDTPRLGGPPLARFIRRLPEEKRTPIREVMRERRDAMRPLRRQMQEARRTMIEALRADTFDRAAFEQAATNYIDTLTTLRRQALTYVPQVAEGLSVAERADLADALMRPRRRGRRGGNR